MLEIRLLAGIVGGMRFEWSSTPGLLLLNICLKKTIYCGLLVMRMLIGNLFALVIPPSKPISIVLLVGTFSVIQGQPEYLKKPKDRKKPVRRRTKPKMKEYELQTLVEEYLKTRGAFFYRIPDAAFKVINSGQSVSLRDKAIISSYLKGLPDLTIFHPTKVYKERYPVVLPLELKVENGKLSQGQVHWQKKIGTIVAYGWDQAKKIIDDFLE